MSINRISCSYDPESNYNPIQEDSAAREMISHASYDPEVLN